MTQFLGAIDQGTTSSRFIIFDKAGHIIAQAQQEHKQITPKPGWVEHDPQEIWARVTACIDEAMEAAKLAPRDLAAIGITNQRETTLVWDKASGAPLHNALVWQDTRVADLVAQFSAQGGQDRYRATTGLPLATYFSGLKLKWLLDSFPNIRAQAENAEALFGTIDSFLIYKLTGAHVTDVTNASRTQLMGLETLAWDAAILADFNIPAQMLPRICSSSEVYGYATHESIKGVPIAGNLGDQQAALFGQTCFKQGEAKNTYGTGCFLLMNTGERPTHSQAGLLTTLGYKLGAAPAVYALEGSIAIAGALVQWLRDNLGLFSSARDIEALAASVQDNGGAYIVPAFSGLYAPYWRNDARGVIAGLTSYVTKAHLARAALEATAYQTREVLEAMETDSGIALASLRVDGGMVVNQLLMQFQADILGKPVVRPRVHETTALGAAYAAGLAVGVYAHLDDLRANWQEAQTWQPHMTQEARAQLFAQWKKAVARSFDWVE
jgi:glycerol kinase